MKIGVLICAYNEEKHIRKVVGKCLKYLKDVIVVNDGSSDGTLEELRKTRALIISYKKNRGKGYALKKGFGYGRKNGFDYLILMDGDGQHDPAELPKFLKAIKLELPDLVVGCRTKRHSDMPYVRRFSNFSTSVLLSAKGRKWVKDTQSGYRAIKLSYLKNLKLKRTRYDLESEMLMKMMKQKAKIKCIGIKTIYGDEVSGIHPIKESFRFFRTLFRK